MRCETTIEEIKEWRKEGGSPHYKANKIIDTLLEEVERLEKHNASSDQAVVELDQKLTIATEALEEIITDGDYTAPEGMKLIARTALNRIKE